MKKEKIELRMYGMVNYQLTGMQGGIQFAHAMMEYAIKYFEDEDFKQWANENKTVIVLNGGTTNNSEDNPGTMQMHLSNLKSNRIKVGTFYEPDLNDSLTAICFLVDERTFNKEKYPDYLFDPSMVPFMKLENMLGEQNVFLRTFLSQFKLA